MEQPNIRQQIINQGLRKGKDAGQIDNALKRWTNKGLTFGEFNQISPFTDLGKDLVHNVGENIAGLKTLGGAVAKSLIEGTLPQDAYNLATDKEFWKQAAQSLAIPYGGWGKQNPWKRLQAIKEHPFDVGLDVMSFGGGSLIKKGGSALANSKKLAKMIENKPLLKSIKRAVLPTDLEKGLNKSIQESKIISRIGQSGIQKKLNEFERLTLGKNFNREQVAKNIVFGTREGSKATVKATNVYKGILDDIDKTATNMGFLQEGITRKNTLAQYLTQTFDELNHERSMKLVDKIESGDLDKIPFQYLDAYNTAKGRYDEGLMGYMSQVLAPTAGYGSDPNKVHSYFEQVRVGGKTQPKDLAPKLEDTVNYLLEQIRRNKLGEAGTKYVFDNMATKLTKETLEELREGKLNPDLVVVNKSDLQDAIKRTFAGTSSKRLERTIAEANDFRKIVDEFDKTGKISKDAFLVDKNHMKMVGNSVEVMRRNRLNSMMKKALLSLPKWVVENRFSNWLNNMMAGVSLKDYYDAIRLFDIAPLHLDELTSYSGFTGDTVARAAIKQAMIKSTARMKKAAQSNDWLGLVDATNELFAAPITRTEAILEKLDRYSNFIHHLKKEAKARNVDWKDLLEKSRTDDTLFFEIYRNVDRELGDYLGRNLALPNKLYEKMGWVYPFWKFPTQTARVATNQLIDHPFKTQLLLHQPSRVGYGEWENIREDLNLAEDDLTGGVPYIEGSPRRGLPHKLLTIGGNQYEALAGLLNQAAGTEGSYTMAGFSPVFSIASRLSDIRDPYGNLAQLEGTITKDGRRLDINERQEYIPSTQDRLKFALKEIGNTFFVPYRQANYFARPALYTAMDKDMYTQYANVLNPFHEGNPYGVPRVEGTDKLGSQWGIRTEYGFVPYRKASMIARQAIRKSKRKYRRTYNTKKRGKD